MSSTCTHHVTPGIPSNCYLLHLHAPRHTRDTFYLLPPTPALTTSHQGYLLPATSYTCTHHVTQGIPNTTYPLPLPAQRYTRDTFLVMHQLILTLTIGEMLLNLCMFTYDISSCFSHSGIFFSYEGAHYHYYVEWIRAITSCIYIYKYIYIYNRKRAVTFIIWNTSH